LHNLFSFFQFSYFSTGCLLGVLLHVSDPVLHVMKILVYFSLFVVLFLFRLVIYITTAPTAGHSHVDGYSYSSFP